MSDAGIIYNLFQVSLPPVLFLVILTVLCSMFPASYLFPFILPVPFSVFPASCTVPLRPYWTLFHVP